MTASGTDNEFGLRTHFVITLLLGVIAAMTFGALSNAEPPRFQGATQIKVQTSDQAVLDYRDGGWWVGDRRVMLSCATEDTCTVEWHPNGAAWIFRLPQA